jgi:hypothetical protein
MGRLVVHNALTVNLQLIGSTTFLSGVVRLAYRPVPEGRDATG